MTRVFVYGTLLTGFHNWKLYVQPMLATGQANLLGEAVTSKAHPMIVTAERNVPAMFNTELGECINGEVYEVSEACIRALDIIEGTNTGFYYRGNIEVLSKEGHGETWTCDTYFKGSGESFGLEDGTSFCCEEKTQIAAWIDQKGASSFIPRYTADLHKSYYINKFMPTVLALASKRTEKEVLEVYNNDDFQARLADAKDKFEESELLGELWKKLV